MILERDTRVKDYLLPTRIYAEFGAENTDALLRSTHTQIYLSGNQTCTIKKGGYLVLDYGKELHGGVRILAEMGTLKGVSTFRLRFGESVNECYSELGQDGACNDHSPRDFNVVVPRLSDLEFGQTGFRFIRIDNISDEDCRLTGVLASFVHLGEPFKGRFSCTDQEVNKIFDTAAYTLYLNMQNRLWDGIKRDRLVWVGDMHPEARGILSLFGSHRLIEQGLKESAEHTPLPSWITGLPSYSVWWIAILCDYEWYTGRWEFAQTQLDYLYGLLEQLDKCVDANGVVNYAKAGNGSSDSFFLNWETCEDNGLECGNRGLMLWTLRKCSMMLTRRGLDAKTVDRIISRLSSNASFDGTSKAVASLYSLGYKPTSEVEKLLTNGGANGFSTFISSYICNALYKMGKGEQALADMKEFYSGMLSRGATTFWESYDPSWLVGSGRIDELTKKGEFDIHSHFGKYCFNGFRLSLCHGWACGPVPFLMNRALGIEFTEVGGKKVKINPDLMGLEWVEGAYPTAYGLIEVSHKQTSNGIKSEYSLPNGVELDKN